MTLDLRDLRVTSLDVDAGAADIDIIMPSKAGHVDATIDAGAADISVLIPEGVAARITKSSGLSSFDIDTDRFPKNNGVYVSPDYDTAENTVTLDFRVGVSKVEVK